MRGSSPSSERSKIDDVITYLTPLKVSWKESCITQTQVELTRYKIYVILKYSLLKTANETLINMTDFNK